MRRKKEDYIVIALGLFLAAVIVGITLVSFMNTRTQQGRPIGSAPTSVPKQLVISTTPTPVLIPMSDSTILYNASDADKIVDLAKNRRVLSDQDIQAKDRMLQKLFAREASGYVYQSPRVNVEYVNSADQFVVEIITTEIESAKKETNDWFISQGFTQKGVCSLPILFYMSDRVKQSLERSLIVFSPIISGCN